MVGDDFKADRGLAQCLSLPFVEAHEFRTCSIDVQLSQHQATNRRPHLAADRVAGVLVGMAGGRSVLRSNSGRVPR